MTKLTKQEMMRAVSDGVREAFVEVLTSDGMLAEVTARDIYVALREGTTEAMWRVATNGTDMPCADFYEAIKQGVAAGMPSEASDD